MITAAVIVLCAAGIPLGERISAHNKARRAAKIRQAWINDHIRNDDPEKP